MTREEAKAWFKVLLKDEYAFNSADREAFAMAIKALEQEPCEDVIDRAEAMTEIMMFAGNVKSDEEDIYIKVSDAVQLLRELPPVNPQPKWIPVSERLPEEYGEYLITWTTSQSKRPFIGISEGEVTGEYDHEHNRFKFEWLLEDYVKNYPDVKVIAWMPLPAPYKMSEIPTGSEGSDKE